MHSRRPLPSKRRGLDPARPLPPQLGRRQGSAAVVVDALVATSTADPIRAHFVSQRDARRRIGVYVVLSGLLVGFLFTSSIAWVALTAAGVLAIAEAYLQPRSRDPTVILGYVDGPLLVMIGGLFVVIAGSRLTGLPQEIFDLAKSIKGVGLDFDSPKDVCVFAILVLVLSNICSNVPTVMLLSGQMMKLDPSIVETGWVILAFSSTVAGNLTLVGSIANLIVAEKAARTGYEFTFFRHLAFAFPTTLVFALAGSLLLFYIV